MKFKEFLKEIQDMDSFMKQGESNKKKVTAKDVDPEELKVGTKIEYEHTDDPKVAEKIALDHLAEHPNYYLGTDGAIGLVDMEKGLKKAVKEDRYSH